MAHANVDRLTPTERTKLKDLLKHTDIPVANLVTRFGVCRSVVNAVRREAVDEIVKEGIDNPYRMMRTGMGKAKHGL